VSNRILQQISHTAFHRLSLTTYLHVIRKCIFANMKYINLIISAGRDVVYYSTWPFHNMHNTHGKTTTWYDRQRCKYKRQNETCSSLQVLTSITIPVLQLKILNNNQIKIYHFVAGGSLAGHASQIQIFCSQIKIIAANLDYFGMTRKCTNINNAPVLLYSLQAN